MRGVQTFAAYAAVGGTSLLTLALLNMVADKFPDAHGINQVRDYLIRRNG